MSKPDCRRCGGAGYVTSGEGRYAAAQVCECSAPCPVCNGTRQVAERRPDGRVFVSPCGCAQVAARIARFNDAQIPAYFHAKDAMRFDDKSPDERAIKRWVVQFQDAGKPGDRGILIVGNPGVGKTHLLCALIRYLTLERGIACRYVDSFQLLHDLKLVFGDANNASGALLEAVCRIPILALDELGKTRAEGWQREVLDTIISRRYDAGLTTFAASNYPLPKAGPGVTDGNLAELALRDTLDQRVGPRVYSRLMERCRAFALNGDDRRLAMASK